MVMPHQTNGRTQTRTETNADTDSHHRASREVRSRRTSHSPKPQYRVRDGYNRPVGEGAQVGISKAILTGRFAQDASCACVGQVAYSPILTDGRRWTQG